MGFVQLHCHTQNGSRLDAIASPTDYAKRAAKFGHLALAVTDHGRLSAIYEHQLACKKEGIKPIIGVEMYVNDSLETLDDKGKRRRTKNKHLVLLAKSEIGYKNMLKLNYLSNKDTLHFYYSPRITPKELFKHSDGIMVGTACLANPFISLLMEGKDKEAENEFEKYVEVFGENLYVEIQLNEITNTIDWLTNGQKTANNFMIRLGNKFGVPIVITGDVHYLEKGQDKLQTLSIAIRDKSTIDNIKFQLESKQLFFHDEEDYINFNEEWKYGYSKSDIISWCNNAVDVANKCNFTIPKRTKVHLPKMSKDDDALLIKKAREGLQKKFKVEGYKKIPNEYRKRLSMELETLIRKGFSSYCMILYDIYEFIGEKGYYRGAGRGSASGSLVLYALDVTTLDPIKYNLLFQRFVSAERTPDMVLNYWTGG